MRSIGNYSIVVNDREYDVSNMVYFSKRIDYLYKCMLHTTSEVLRGNKNKNKLKREYRLIKNDLEELYAKVSGNAEKEFYDLYRDLEDFLHKMTPNIYSIEWRMKSLESLLQKMLYYHQGVFEPGKSPFISDIFGIRITTPNNVVSMNLCETINNLVYGCENLTFYLETPLIKEKRENKRYKGAEVILEYGDHTIRWKGVVIENLKEDDRIYINLLIGVPLNYYRSLKGIFKNIAKKKKHRGGCEEFSELCEYEVVDKSIREAFQSNAMYVKYDVENGVMGIILPHTQTHKMESYKGIIEKLISNIPVEGLRLLKEELMLRPHYGIEMFEIPLLFNKMRLSVKELNPWEREEPPKEIIIKGNESYFYSTKVAYYSNREGTPLFEIQVMDAQQRHVFRTHPHYHHHEYVKKKRRKIQSNIDLIVSSSYDSNRDRREMKKFLNSIYREFLSL